MTSKKPSASTLKKKADVYAGAWFRRSGRCAAPGACGVECSQRIEWAHLKSRGEACIRHSPLNALPLCWAHHKHFTSHPDLFVTWVEETFPGRWDALNDLIVEHRATRQKVDYSYWIDWYKSRQDSWLEWMMGGATDGALDQA